jgi:peptide chain release factor 2
MNSVEVLRKNASRHSKNNRDGWGHQIRSYILDRSVVKDARTGVETCDVKAVLDGDLDQFILPTLLLK